MENISHAGINPVPCMRKEESVIATLTVTFFPPKEVVKVTALLKGLCVCVCVCHCKGLSDTHYCGVNHHCMLALFLAMVGRSL